VEKLRVECNASFRKFSLCLYLYCSIKCKREELLSNYKDIVMVVNIQGYFDLFYFSINLCRLKIENVKCNLRKLIINKIFQQGTFLIIFLFFFLFKVIIIYFDHCGFKNFQWKSYLNLKFIRVHHHFKWVYHYWLRITSFFKTFFFFFLIIKKFFNMNYLFKT